MTAEDLRKSILQQAIQGKLVPQNPSDEPASVLLERIRTEKARLVKSGKVYKKKDTPPFLVEENYPFDIPDNWSWVQLSDVSIIQEGAGIRKYQYTSSGIQLLCVTNILEGEIDLGKKQLFISEQEYKNKYIHLTPQYGDIITACSGGSWGKVAIYESEATVMLNTSTLRLRFFSDLACNKYLYYICKSDLFKKQLSEQLAGIQPNFGYAHYSRICFPLPPLAEQKRIVERIEELMSKVEKYEMSKVALDKLESDLHPNLKKSILQYAIQGKLVPQNPDDEPASVLLERIRAEKAHLVKEKKIKKDKNESRIYRTDDGHWMEHFEDKSREDVCIDEEIPFDVPSGWEWCRLGCLLTVKGGKRIPLGKTFSSEPTSHIYIRVTDMKNNTLIDSNLKYISDEVYNQIKNYTISKDDLYLTIAGTIGSIGVVPEKFDNMNLTENAVKLTNISINKFYIVYAVLSQMVQNQFVDRTKQMAQPKLAIERILTTIFPLPPLAEQKRIVAALEAALPGLDKIPV